MLTVCFFYWSDPTDRCARVYTYSVEDVLILRSQVTRHLSVPHRFVVVTDQPVLFDASVEAVLLSRQTHLRGTRFAKLMLFHPEAAEMLGDRILYLDLDSVVVGDLDPLVDRDEDLVLWRNPNAGLPRRAFYNTSIILLRAGSRPEFWTKFDPVRSPAMLRGKWGGTDQAWVSHIATRDEAHWTAADGVYGAGRLGDYHPELATTRLPENARIVFFPGRRHPKMAEVQTKHPWIKEHRW